MTLELPTNWQAGFQGIRPSRLGTGAVPNIGDHFYPVAADRFTSLLRVFIYNAIDCNMAYISAYISYRSFNMYICTLELIATAGTVSDAFLRGY